MPVDYESIRRENEIFYGSGIGSFGQPLLADAYADRTHFILELLQNAEDALRRRERGWEGSRTVSFHLTQTRLRFSHDGDPFNEADVRGICRIGDSIKQGSLTDIGRYGMGFKSVYAFTDCPEVYSGPEAFAIESFVWPKSVPPIPEKHPDKTVIQLPFKSEVASAHDDIAAGLRGLGSRTLLFLRHIEEIEWEVEDGGSGCYLRETNFVDNDVRRLTVIGQAAGEDDAAEEWLVFSRAVCHDENPAGWVEIAFKINPDDPKRQRIHPIREASNLVVFFPTVLDTRLGFLMQGPYRTTRSRDNVPFDDEWNRHLVHETAALLQDALRWMRDNDTLDVDALNCLPFESPSVSLCTPTFEATKDILSTEPLLPRFDHGYVAASRAMLSRPVDLQQLLSPDQLSALHGDQGSLVWLSSDITVDRARTLHKYLMDELDVREVTPEYLIQRTTPSFIQCQADDWMRRLYEFLAGRPALLRLLDSVALIRLTDGRQVAPNRGGPPSAFLPTDIPTEFPTVAKSVCASDGALSFLKSLGIAEPDPVDDVIHNLLPKYQQIPVSVSDADHVQHVGRILRAERTDSSTRRLRLIRELKRTSFVRAVDAGDCSTRWARPADIYLPTVTLKELFDGVAGVLFPDDPGQDMQSERMLQLLEDCGSSRSLKPVECPHGFTDEELSDFRRMMTGTTIFNYWRKHEVTDWTLRDLDGLLPLFSTLNIDQRRERSKLLWEELVELEDRDFYGTYTWFRYQEQYYHFDAKFVRQINNTAWVPDANGGLELARNIFFEDLGWKKNPSLESKIQFKPPEPPARAELAREFGVEPEAIDLIKKHEITTAELEELVRAKDAASKGAGSAVAGSQAGSPGGAGASGNGSGGTKSGVSVDPVEAALSINERYFRAMTTSPADAPDAFVSLPPEGPLTAESAVRHTRQSRQLGDGGQQVQKESERWVPSEAASELADGFRRMVHSDYVKRCQICGTSFMMKANRELQVFVVHVVPPSTGDGTNHFGNLMGLCGRHYALVRHGAWHWLDPETGKPAESAEHMGEIARAAPRKTDDSGNEYVAVTIRFANVYKDWSADPTTIDEKIHFSIPHWEYLCELLGVG